MGISKIEERNIRKLAKAGNGTSYSITLPIDAVRAFGWSASLPETLRVSMRAGSVKRFSELKPVNISCNIATRRKLFCLSSFLGRKEKQKLAIEVDKGKKRIIIKDWEG